MADEQIQPDEQNPLDHEASSLVNKPDQPATNRPADNARVAGPSQVEGFSWAPSDEATDFLGLNDPTDPAAAGGHAAGNGAGDPYAMPAASQNEEPSRTTWLLNEATQPAQAGAEWQTAPGARAETPSWLMDGQEPAPQAAPDRGDGTDPGSIQPAPPVGAGGAHPTDPNWLLNLDDQRAAQGGMAPVVGGSQEAPAGETPRGLDASFVDAAPTGLPLGTLILRSLTAVGVIAGSMVGWKVFTQQGELQTPLTAPITREGTAQRAPRLEQPLERPQPAGGTVDPGERSGANERTALAPERANDGERRWFSNLSPRATDGANGGSSEPSELDGDSYPWAVPSEQAVEQAQAVLLAFGILMGDTPVAQVGPMPSVATDRPLEVVDQFDSLAVVLPDALPEIAGGVNAVGPPTAVAPDAALDLPPVPRWLTLNERLLGADRSILDQYNSWRLHGGDSSARSMTVAPRAGLQASIEPTLEIPFFVATIGAASGLLRNKGPKPSSDLAGMDQAGGLPKAGAGTRLAVEVQGDSGDRVALAQDTPALDPRRIEKDPLFSLQARVPGKDDVRRRLENHWTGVNIPMHALDYPERVLTPRVGGVRLFHQNGEGFEGMLFAMGMGTVWVDTEIGRMALKADAIHRIERLDASRLAALQRNGTPTAGLTEVRVKAAGGVFVGYELDRAGDQITMVTEKGYKITLRSDEVELASTRRATTGIRRPGR